MRPASLYFCSGRRISIWLFVVNFNFSFSIGQRFRAGRYKISHLQQYLPVGYNFMNANIIQRWRSEGIELNALATDLEFSICEIKVGFTFPEDFKRMYRIVNGFKSLNMDSRLLSLWPLDRIINEYPGLDFIPFSDYLANGSQCGFIKNQLGIFRNYNPNWVCKTFDEFIEHWESETGEYI